MAAPAIAGMMGGIFSSAIGAAEKSAARGEQRQLIQQAIQEYERIGLPSIEAQQLVLEELKSAGQLTPDLEQQVLQGSSAVGEISTDAGYKDAQLAALDELRSIGEGGGMRLSDRAALADMQSQTAQAERGSREAILAGARARGMSGGGTELAAQLANQQGAAQRASSGGLDIAANAQDRALQAIMQGGQLGGQLRTQEYGEKLDAAQAADDIARFNAMNQIGMGQRNVDRGNVAQTANLAEAQRLADANVATRNQQQAHNKGLYQDRFQNELALASGKGNVYTQQGNAAMAAGQDKADMWGGIGQGLNQMGTQYGQTQMQTQGPKNVWGGKMVDEGDDRKRMDIWETRGRY